MGLLRIIADINGVEKPDVSGYVPTGSADGSQIQIVLNSVYAIMGLVAVGFIIYGGFTWIMSQGDPSKLTKARNAIIYAVIGLLIVLLATAITNFVIGAGNGATPSGSGYIVGGF